MVESGLYKLSFFIRLVQFDNVSLVNIIFLGSSTSILLWFAFFSRICVELQELTRTRSIHVYLVDSH